MTDPTDMSTPVTRSELRSEIEDLERRLDRRFLTKDEFDARVATLVTKDEFDAKIATLVTKADFDAKIATLVTKDDLKVQLDTWGRTLLVELARHVKAIEESMRREISVIDDKYADLPGRVSRLESVVLSRKRR